MRFRAKLGTAVALVALALPAAASARSVYVTNNPDAAVSVFAADPATGVLSPSTAALTGAGDNPESVVLTPDARHLYVANAGEDTISGYDVAADGSLTEVAGSPFGAGDLPYGLSATADGRYLYVTDDGDGDVRGYAIGADGALAPIPGSPWDTGSGAIAIATSPDAKLLYSLDDSAAGLDGFAIGADGALTPLAATMPDPGPQTYAIAFAPNGKRLYAGNYDPATVAGYSVDAAGALTPLPGSPYSVNDAPFGSLAISPDGKSMYIPGNAAGDLGAYSIAPDGALAAVGGSPYPAGTDPTGSAVSPDGRYVYVADFVSGANVQAFARAADGTLAPVAGSPFTSGGGGGDLASLAITPNRSPRAQFRVVPKSPSAGERTRFNAEASSDADGTVGTYAWNFGDGTRKSGPEPVTGHRYEKAGTYTAKLTLTDSEGCSAKPIYTGQTASCQGSASAVATKTVEVVDRAVDGAKIKADDKQRQRGDEIVVRLSAGAKEQVDVVATGTVKIRGEGKRLALVKASKSIRANALKKLKLRLKRPSANFKVSRALQAERPVKARVHVRMSDAAGNRIDRSLAIELK
jgi:6-phosphogluconolactonase (cycloisomerase 2 family)